MGHIHGTVYNEAYYWAKWEQRKGRILIDDVDQDCHVYVLEWTPERIDILVDDAEKEGPRPSFSVRKFF
jgi:hypothetical protein